MDNLLFSPGALTGKITLADGVTEVNPLQSMGLPRGVAVGTDWHMAFALTPTSTTVTIAHMVDSGISGLYALTGATARLVSTSGADDVVAANLKHLRVFARRKPGTSGAMVAQSVIFGGTAAGSMAEIGRISVLANSGTGEPDSDFYDQSFVNGHSRFTADETTPFRITITAVDTDLELVVAIFAQQP